MTAAWTTSDEPFFLEWNARRSGERRSLGRAQAFADALDLDLAALPPALTVVGSKGKGTAVAYASHVLHVAGLRVGSVVSPAFRRNAERIRVDGRGLTEGEYAAAAQRACRAIRRLERPTDGYLSPTGAFTLTGADVLHRHGVDVLVMEEGLGGLSDEVSLVSPTAVVVTPIFEEHQALLGETIPAIAHDLVGVARKGTTDAIWTTEQSDDARREIEAVARSVGARIYEAAASPWHEVTKQVPGLGAPNATAGAAAGAWLAERLGYPIKPSGSRFEPGQVSLPGRLSVHPAEGLRLGTWVIDAAVSAAGAATALQWCRTSVGEPDLILACFPDTKNPASCFAVLPDESVSVTAGESYLSFDGRGRRLLVPARRALRDADAVNGVVLCLGTVSFVGEVLEHVNAVTDRFW